MQECDLELINEAVYEYISQYVDPQDILKKRTDEPPHDLLCGR